MATPTLEPALWSQVLLGYLPMKRHDEWNAIQGPNWAGESAGPDRTLVGLRSNGGEKRALYASYRSELLAAGDDVTIRSGPRSPGVHGSSYGGASGASRGSGTSHPAEDVERTRRDMEYFRRPGTKVALTALLFVYAKLNPGVRYVQGREEAVPGDPFGSKDHEMFSMNEIAAILLYVMSVDPEKAETDAFWCFTEMMVETWLHLVVTPGLLCHTV
eukprot:Skav209600  [mRNA]  locus=scaffold1634:18683:22097:- [translate_table: standard]